MPYVKSIPIHSTVNRSIAYILNPDKTEDCVYTAALNCIPNAKDAYLAMKMVYEHFSGEKYNAPMPLTGKASVKAIHYIQSFSPNENLTAEQVHKIGKAFARKTFGDDCQIVIATHLDKGHIHNHFILNAYSVTGKKFNDNKTTLKKVREYSDRVCLAFGIQPISESKGQQRSKSYNEWENVKKGTSWKQKIKIEIDRLIGYVKNLDELLSELEAIGYEVKRGKYISLKAPEQKRFVRTKTLGEDYTEESLISRIRWRDTGTYIAETNIPAPIRDDYINAIYNVKQLAISGKKVQRKRFASQPYSSDNDIDLYKLSAQLSIINRDSIHSIGELEGKINKLKVEYENARQELNQLSVKTDRFNSLAEQAEIYAELSDKQQLTAAEQLKLNICRQTLKNNNMRNISDIDRLKSVNTEINKKIAALKSNFENCKRLYEIYADIAKTYSEISTGDYISKLVAEEQKRRDKEKNKSKLL